MIGGQEERHSRIGRGIVLDGKVLYAMRSKDDPGHERIMRNIMPYAERGMALVVSSLSLAELARRIQADRGSKAVGAMLDEAWSALNIVAPVEEDLREAAGFLSQGVALTLEEAVAGAVARRLGCSIYGSSPAYHLFRIPVIIDSAAEPPG